MPPIPLLIVTGPLGAGKTTAVNLLLRAEAAQGHRPALLVNEFGETSIDGALLSLHRPELAGVADLVNGCACCTLREDVVVTLEAWCTLPEAQRPDRILLETTGLADPTDLVDLERDPRLAGRLQLAGLLTVLSCRTPLDTLLLDPLLHRQLSLAGLIHLTKGDTDPEGEAAWQERLAQDFPGIPVVLSRQGQGVLAEPDPWQGDGGGRSLAAGPVHPGASFTDARSHSIQLDHPIDPAALETLLTHPPAGGRLLRAKGIFRFHGLTPRPDGGEHWVFQWADWRVDLSPLDWQGPEPPVTQAVLIGRNLDSVAWRNAFHALERPPAGARRRLALPARSSRRP